MDDPERQSVPSHELVARVESGDREALAEFFEEIRPRLRRMLDLRIDRRVRPRVAPSDIIQEAFIEAERRLPSYSSEDGRMPAFLWLRFLTGEKLLQTHRAHLGPQRGAKRDVSMFDAAGTHATSAVLAARLIGRITPPSHAAARAELRILLEEALESMRPLDREVLVLRHFEQLSGVEAAQVLGIDVSSASKRYLRAVKRLSRILAPLASDEPGDARERRDRRGDAHRD